MEWHKENYTISTDKARLDLGMIHHFLYTTAYWSVGRPMDMVRKSIDNSLCFGVYDGDNQVGFARLVTDYATFGWICDVFIQASYRGRGLGKWLVECIMDHPEIKGLRRVILSSRDAHAFYQKAGGFQHLQYPDNWMEKFTDTPFRKTKKPAPEGNE
ncbi:MAG: GNAT family N-acetyltransferase [Acidobacteriaceae bacterium]